MANLCIQLRRTLANKKSDPSTCKLLMPKYIVRALTYFLLTVQGTAVPSCTDVADLS